MNTSQLVADANSDAQISPSRFGDVRAGLPDAAIGSGVPKVEVAGLSKDKVTGLL